MKFNRLVARSLSIALVGIAAAASAQATGLTTSPDPLSLSARGGILSYGYINVQNTGPGFASNLAVSILPSNGGYHGHLRISSDTCTGATLAQNGTCRIGMEFEGGCFVRPVPADVWHVQVTSTQFPATTTQVNGTTTSYSCD